MKNDKEIEKIITECENWAKNNLNESFIFRDHQLEATVSIVLRAINETKIQIMKAPTGSGKSIISMIAAGVLFEHYGLTSYILVSDISLFDQYVDDFRRYNLNWGALKGKDNYYCKINGNNINCSECSIQNISMQKLMDEQESESLGYECANECEYMLQRKKAIKQPITLMTYQFYLIQRNYINEQFNGADNESTAPFQDRDLIICDEAHKLNDIIQSHFAPRMNKSKTSWMKLLEEYAEKNDLPCPDGNRVIDIANNICSSDDTKILFNGMVKYNKLCAEYGSLNEIIRKDVRKNQNYRNNFKYLTAGNIARECCCKFTDFVELAKEHGKDILVKTEANDEIIINCIYEDTMVKKYFHDKSNSELLMSATFNDIDIYKKMIGCSDLDKNDWSVINIPSTFDYSNSPIYYSCSNKMSFKEKQVSGPIICQQITKICNKYSDVKGIIQTGNYENSKLLMQELPLEIRNRCIQYVSAKDKNEALELFDKSTNGILIGPTLLEGLNFEGDKCRFCICMKLPYASLANNLVKAKIKLMPEWYNFDLISKLEQGFGRGIRYNGDWCITFILDGCINNVVTYNNKMFFNTTLERFIKIK